MIDDKLKEEIKSVVASIFSEKEEADSRLMTEKALNDCAEKINELTTHLEEKSNIVAANQVQIEEANNKILSVTSELEAAKKETEDLKIELEKATSELTGIKMDKIAELRMSELEAAEVADSDKVAQFSKVRAMTEEEFTSYKSDRISFRDVIVAKLAKATEELAASNQAPVIPEVPAEPKVEDAAIVVPPANIDMGHAVSAALNMEIVPSKDVVSKYAELGKAMANSMKSK